MKWEICKLYDDLYEKLRDFECRFIFRVIINNKVKNNFNMYCFINNN